MTGRYDGFMATGMNSTGLSCFCFKGLSGLKRTSNWMDLDLLFVFMFR